MIELYIMVSVAMALVGFYCGYSDQRYAQAHYLPESTFSDAVGNALAVAILMLLLWPFVMLLIVYFCLSGENR